MSPMIKTLWTSLLFLLPAMGLAQTTYRSLESRRAFYDELVAEYCSPPVRRVMASDKTQAFDAYVDGYTTQDLVSSFGTVIHELLHGLNGTGAGIQAHSYFVGEKEMVQVPLTEVFSSRKLNGFVRKGLQDSIFRYGLYVGGREELAHHGNQSIRLNKGGSTDVFSVSYGVYGLVEEFNAYYLGGMALLELYPWYQKEVAEDDQDAWSDYRHHLMGDAVAYYEFRLFIAWYLLYAEAEEPAIFGAIMDNAPLRKAFTSLERGYRDLLRNIEGMQPELNALAGPTIGDFLDVTGSDDEIRQFLADNGIDAAAMGLEPGTPEWEQLKAEYLRAMGEAKASVPKTMDLWHAQPSAQISWLQDLTGEPEKAMLARFRLTD